MSDLVTIARRLTFIRETDGPNRGAWVSMLQRFCHGQPGDAWCADFVSFVLDVQYRGKSPLVKTGSTIQLLADARAKGLIRPLPVRGGLYFFVRATSGEPHHVGIVTGVDPLMGIAGNTSSDGMSDEGVGVFEHPISESNTVYVTLP